MIVEMKKESDREVTLTYGIPVPPSSRVRPGPHDHDHDHGHENINLRGALLHVLGDLIQSMGVAVAGLLIWWKQDDPRWYICDPICTFLFSVLVVITTYNLLKDIMHTLMEGSPDHVDVSHIEQHMHQIEGVHDIHDLHIWNLTLGIPILTAHVHIGADTNAEQVLKKLEAYVRTKGIKHSTIQICNPLGSSELSE